MVNVNIEIPDELHKRLKLAAVMDETTIKQLVIDILSENDQKAK
jgi:predicted HicB family RNase H-like nuclease